MILLVKYEYKNMYTLIKELSYNDLSSLMTSSLSSIVNFITINEFDRSLYGVVKYEIKYRSV